MPYGAWTFLITVIFATVVWIASCIISSIKCWHYPKELRKNHLFKRAKKKRNIWFSMAMLWLIVEYVGVIVPFEASCLALIENTIGDSNKKATIIYSIISMIFVIVIYAIHPHRHTTGYRRAYKEVENSINNYISGQPKDNELVESLKKGEDFIDGGFDL